MPCMGRNSRRTVVSAVSVLVLAVAAWQGLDLGLGGESRPVAQVIVPAGQDTCPQLELVTSQTPGQLNLPASDFAALWNSEVLVPQELTVSYNGNLGRYGQLTLSVGGRMYHPNNGTCSSHLDDGPRFVVLEDGLDRQNPTPVPWLSDEDTLRTGSTLTELAGWLGSGTVYMRDSGFDSWSLVVPDDFLIVDAVRPYEAPDPGGDITVAGFNVGNYFTTLGDRGARDAEEFDRQHTKLVAALNGLGAQLIAIAEIENDEGRTLNRLVNGPGGLGPVSGQDWAWVQAEGFGRGNDDIGLAFLYRSDLLAPVGATMADTHAIHNRPPLAQRFRELASGLEFTVVMAHLKSRGGCEPYDPDEGSGCWNERRDSQVRQMLEFIREDVEPFASGGILILGDLNSYALEAPIDRIRDAGFMDLLAEFVPAAERYTYVYQPGVAGYLDHALADTALAGSVCGAAVWHINADEPSFLSWSGARFGPDLYSPDQFRSSDHDPVLVGLDLTGEC